MALFTGLVVAKAVFVLHELVNPREGQSKPKAIKNLNALLGISLDKGRLAIYDTFIDFLAILTRLCFSLILNQKVALASIRAFKTNAETKSK